METRSGWQSLVGRSLPFCCSSSLVSGSSSNSPPTNAVLHTMPIRLPPNAFPARWRRPWRSAVGTRARCKVLFRFAAAERTAVREPTSVAPLRHDQAFGS
jgi:hypothetical protein